MLVEAVAEHEGVARTVRQQATGGGVRDNPRVEEAVFHIHRLVVDQFISHVEDEHGVGDRRATVGHLVEVAPHGNALAAQVGVGVGDSHLDGVDGGLLTQGAECL